MKIVLYLKLNLKIGLKFVIFAYITIIDLYLNLIRWHYGIYRKNIKF